jgi:hypothetical protein
MKYIDVQINYAISTTAVDGMNRHSYDFVRDSNIYAMRCL